MTGSPTKRNRSHFEVCTNSRFHTAISQTEITMENENNHSPYTPEVHWAQPLINDEIEFADDIPAADQEPAPDEALSISPQEPKHQRTKIPRIQLPQDDRR